MHLTLFFTEAEMTLAYGVVVAGTLLSLARPLPQRTCVEKHEPQLSIMCTYIKIM